MIIIKEKVKDFPTLIFLMIFDFWAGTGWGGVELSYHDLDDLDKQADQDSKSDLVDQHDHHNLMICKALVSG